MVNASSDNDAVVRSGSTDSGRSVLILSAHYPPSRSAGTHRILRFSRDLTALGWRVSVLTLAPASYRPGTPVDEGLCREVPVGVRVVRTKVPGRGRSQAPTPRTEGPRPGQTPEARRFQWLRRQWQLLCSTPDRELAWCLSAIPAGVRLVEEQSVDVILSSAPPFTAHLIAAEVARRTGRPWVADFRDPWARAPWGSKWRNAGWTGWVHRYLERRTIALASKIIVNTKRMQADFESHYDAATAPKFQTITNGFDTASLNGRARPVRRTASTETLVLCHAGNLYQARDPRPLLRALALLRQAGTLPVDAFRLQFVGSAGDEFDTAGHVVSLGLESVVEFVPPVGHGEGLGYMRAADVLVAIQPDTTLQIPVKVYEYLWARRPILALASEGAVADLLAELGAGVVVPAADEGAIATALARLYAGRRDLGEAFAVPDDLLGRLEGRELSRVLSNLLGDVADGRAHR